MKTVPGAPVSEISGGREGDGRMIQHDVEFPYITAAYKDG